MTVTEAPPAVVAADESTFESLAERVDTATRAVAGLDPGSRLAATELQESIEAFHKAALLTIVRRMRDDPRGKELLFELVDDPGVHAVLALHGIIRPSLMVRANRTLDSVRPYLRSHGGDVELVEVRDGVAVVRLQGSCNGCSMSAVTLREGVEEALLKGIPEISAVEVLPNEPTAAFIPLGSIGHKPTDKGWVQGPVADDIADGSLRRVDIGEESFIVTNIANRFAVFRNECAHQGMSLDGGMIDAGVLQCPWHGFRYDASSGECLSAPGAQLQQVPMRVEGGLVWIRAH